MQQHMGLSRKAVPPRIQFQNGYELGFWSAIFFFLKPKSLVKSLAAAFQVRLFDLAKGVEMGELQEHEEWMSHIVWMVLVVKSVVKNDGSMELSKKLLFQWVDFHLFIDVVPHNTYNTLTKQLALFVPHLPMIIGGFRVGGAVLGVKPHHRQQRWPGTGSVSGIEDSDPLTGWIYGMILIKLESKDDFMILDLEWPSKDRTLSGMYFSGSASLPQVRLVQLMKTWLGLERFGQNPRVALQIQWHECRWSVCKLQESLSKSGTLIYVQLPVGSMERFPVATIRGTRLAVNSEVCIWRCGDHECHRQIQPTSAV